MFHLNFEVLPNDNASISKLNFLHRKIFVLHCRKKITQLPKGLILSVVYIYVVY